MINSLKLGVCKLNHYFFKKRGKHPDGLCDICKEPETIDHYLLRCKNKLADKIKEWFKEKYKDPALKDILSELDGIDLILKFNYRDL
jgi:hypothetical protein